MKFSTENIKNKHFSKQVFGGLSEFEVRDFLYVLSQEIKHLFEADKQQKQKIEELQANIKDYRDREHILKDSIQSAEKWATKIRENAEQNSSLVLEKAQSKSESLIQEAKHSLQTVYTDILDLKRIQLQFKTGLKAALQVQMDLLDQDPILQSQNTLNTTNIESLLENQENINKISEKDPVEDMSLEDLKSMKKQIQIESSQAEFSQTESSQIDSTQQETNTFKKHINDSELQSLKKSLQSLNKSFT